MKVKLKELYVVSAQVKMLHCKKTRAKSQIINPELHMKIITTQKQDRSCLGANIQSCGFLSHNYADDTELLLNFSLDKWTHKKKPWFPPTPWLVFADCAREALADLNVADVLIFQLRRAPDAERRHVILEILGSLNESGKTGGQKPDPDWNVSLLFAFICNHAL